MSLLVCARLPCVDGKEEGFSRHPRTLRRCRPRTREELELTQEEFAERAKIHRTYLSDIERGSRNVSLINIEKIAAALSLSLSELFDHVEG